LYLAPRNQLPLEWRVAKGKLESRVKKEQVSRVSPQGTEPGLSQAPLSTAALFEIGVGGV
jgi:hypothetical protein